MPLVRRHDERHAEVDGDAWRRVIGRDQRAEFSRQMRRRRGRPRLDVPMVQTSVKIPAPVYDALCLIALRDRESVHSRIQEAVASYVRTHPPD